MPTGVGGEEREKIEDRIIKIVTTEVDFLERVDRMQFRVEREVD